MPRESQTQVSRNPTQTPGGAAALRTVFVHTFGCQMNEYDSTKLLEQLRTQGYRAVGSAEAADLVLVNTCAIREKAEHKMDSLLGTLGEIKAQRPGQVIGVTGCVAQERGADILKRVKTVDLVLGTDALYGLPAALARVERGERVAWTEWNAADRGPQPTGRRVRNFVPEVAAPPDPQAATTWPGAGAQAPWLDAAGAPSVIAQLAITKGCDNFCTFCIVPYTRGREVSREPGNIEAEARALVERGVREITLLGQNVNSYSTGGTDFVDLLGRLGHIPGLARLRYTSPHPKDFSLRLAQAHRDLPALCEHLHLPVQSGSDTILAAMRRNHTIAEYVARTEAARQLVPRLTITSDIIVGFPGETEQDFQGTLDLMRRVRFDQVYAFKFSPRLQTPAAGLPDQVPEQVKAERLERLFLVHDGIVRDLLSQRVGTRQEVLVEGPARFAGAVTGRTRGNTQTTVVDCKAPAGTLVPVEIAAARRFALTARPLPSAEEAA